MKRVLKILKYLILGILFLITLALLTAYILWYKPISSEELHSLINESDKIVIKEAPMQGSKILFESSSKIDIKSFSDSLVLKDNISWFMCACLGSPAIYFYKDGKQVLHLTNHHGHSIRSSLWTSDVEIENVDKWVAWFDKHGISSVREEVEYSKAIKEQSIINTKKWIKKMPKSLVVFGKESLDIGSGITKESLEKALEIDVPNKSQRILALLDWYGSGAGPWSGFPSYEQIAENMLLKYNTEDIVNVVELTKLSDSQKEGTARLFGGWTFSKQRPDGLKKVPSQLKEQLWDYVKSTKDEDKLSRAKRAFKNKEIK